MSERVARRLVIRGTVQGVWFRESMRIEADRMGITGWVRNRPDGSVEALVEGAPHAVEAILRWAHQGPEAAVVTGVEQAAANPENLARFEKRPTG